jgi:uncharacterized small protein (DUF1192 family)
MTFKDVTRHSVALAVAAQLLLATYHTGMAQAGMISTDSAIADHVAETSRAELLTEVRRDEVRAELVRQGVDPSEAEARIVALTDAEIRRTMAQMDENSAGASIAGTIATVFIILLVTDLLCLTRLFNFTRCVR